jgi:hypothetical protein
MEARQEYITVSVREVWNDLIAVRDKYVEEAQASGKGLRIVYKVKDRPIMLEIDHQHLKNGRKGTKAYKDKFSNKSHYLIYFPIVAYSSKNSQETQGPAGNTQNAPSFPPQSTLFDNQNRQ